MQGHGARVPTARSCVLRVTRMHPPHEEILKDAFVFVEYWAARINPVVC